MASKGSKRQSMSVAAQAKKRRTDCVDIAKAVKQAKDLPPHVSHLLASLAPHSLAVYSDERHAFQVNAVGMVGNALKSVEAELQKEVNDASAKIAGRDADKAARERTVIQTAGQLAAKKGEAALKEAAIVQVEMKYNHAKHNLAEAQKALKVPERDHKEAAAKHADLQKVLNERVLPLKEAAGTKKAIEELLKVLHKFTVDESLLSTLPSVAAKAPADRGDFDALTFDNLEKALTSKGHELAEGVRAAEPRKAQCEAAVEAVNLQYDAAKDALKNAKDASTEAEKAVHDTEHDLTKAKKSNNNFDDEMKAAEGAVGKTKKNLAAFHAGPMEAFVSLKAMTAPPPPAPPAPAVVDDAAAAS